MPSPILIQILTSFVCCIRAESVENINEYAVTFTPTELYHEGVRNYLNNDYDGCIRRLEEAVSRFNTFTHKLRNCRLSCHEESASVPFLYAVDVENLRFFDQTYKNTLCLIKCKKRELLEFDGYQPDAHAQDVFGHRKPYQYLYACYAHNKQLQKAANAAFTYLVKHPNDIGVSRAFNYYIQQREVERDQVINYEADDFVEFYEQGMQSYVAKQWEDVVSNMETSLRLFLRSEDECRVQCEDSFDHEWLPDFIPAIANHFTHVLLCKRKCNQHMSTLHGEKHDDLLPSHYHYLQYAYFKAAHLKQACQATSSYLLWYPDDATMAQNLEYYRSLSKVQEDYFEPRADALHYMRRKTYEERVYKYVTDVFAIEAQKEDETMGKAKFLIPKPPRKRFAQDNVITEVQCEQLVEISNNYSVAGDGYMTGSTSPHTIHEEYSGLSLKGAASLFNARKLSWSNINILLNVTRDIKAIIERQFSVERKLHFSYTHLVCRSAKKSDTTFNRTDLSHSVHADNCNIEENGTCPKEWPAFTWRDYTAILYLNSDFVGGDLFFSEDFYGNSIEEAISPQCGRLVGFTSGVENLHGVKAIYQGSRCALAIWFTYDEKNKERERDTIVEVVDELD